MKEIDVIRCNMVKDSYMPKPNAERYARRAVFWMFGKNNRADGRLVDVVRCESS